MPRRPRSDKADRLEAIHADFDLLGIEDSRFVVRSLKIALAVKERGQGRLAETSSKETREPATVSPESQPVPVPTVDSEIVRRHTGTVQAEEEVDVNAAIEWIKGNE